MKHASRMLPVILLLYSTVACSEPTRQRVPDENDTPRVGLSTIATLVAPPLVGEPVQSASKRVEQPFAPAEPSPSETPRLGELPEAALLANRIVGFYEDNARSDTYIQVDKPLYRPGESIWFRVWNFRSADFLFRSESAVMELVNPKGAVVLSKELKSSDGLTNDFELGAEAVGGEYKLVAKMGARTVERTVVVASYEPPRLRMKLDFLRRAYGPGDRVQATLRVDPATGGTYALRDVRAQIRLDGAELPEVKAKTDKDGATVVSFVLPADIARGDGFLTVLCEDGGVTESISRRIPIVLRKLELSFFPEGGDLVEGLESRVYFQAKTPLGKVADVRGHIVDDHGNRVSTFETYERGLGRTTLLPASSRRYFAEVTSPVGVSERFALPLPKSDGCVMRAFDDIDSSEEAIRVAVSCTEARTVVLAATLREEAFDTATVDVTPGAPAVVFLKPRTDAMANAQGVARVTLFDERMQPLAERVVFRNRRGGLVVELEPAKERYAPRDAVSLSIVTKNAKGKPVPATLALSVIDDTVRSYADDKTAHMLARILLEAELPGDIEEPNFFFDTKEEKSAFAMELLLGTRGYRRFEWAPVMSVEPDAERRALLRAKAKQAMEEEAARQMKLADMIAREAMPAGALPRRAAMPMPAPMPRLRQPMPAPLPAPPAMPRLPDAPPRLVEPLPNLGRPFPGFPARERAEKKRIVEFAPVRVFPIPDYRSETTQAGPRTDFRDTIFWAPNVKTGDDGRATVKFPTSDALTTFRVFAEGAGGGTIGRKETTFESSLPFGLFAKLPQEVSEGDRILLPVTLANERTSDLDIRLISTFGESLVPAETPDASGIVSGGQKRSVFFPLDVKGREPAEVKLQAKSGELSDELVRTVRVAPLGFPQMQELSGRATGTVRHEIDLTGALPNAVDARLTLYASPVSTLLGGLEGMLRKPSGCFEQTSSTNYPNVMVLRYLKEHEVADAELMTRASALLAEGYGRLSGYESANKGYEWFGGDPGHEALTAYGLVQFAAMQDAWGEVDLKMVERTKRWLQSRRDGKGGYLRDPKALDSFGRASPEVTNAYITWALARTGTRGIDKELEVQRALAKETKDAYLLGLAAGALLSTPSLEAEGKAAAARLARMQDKDGAFRKADHSITRSGGRNLEIETTSLAVLAFLQAKAHEEETTRAVDWLQNNRSGFGEWGATQATVLALEALTAHANASRSMKGSGTITLRINGKVVATAKYDEGRREPLVFADFGKALLAGKNVVEIENAGTGKLPYSMAVDYRALDPQTSPNVAVRLDTALAKDALGMGETVRLDVRMTNTTDKGLPLTVARVGLPGGLAPQLWQLKELKERGEVAFYETRPREVTLYFRDFRPREEKALGLELVAEVPGSYTAPASSAYLYYTDDLKFWAPPVKVAVAP